MISDGRAWIEHQYGAERAARINAFLSMVMAEGANQNLIAPSTVETIWERHALDSAQLLQWDVAGTWLDIGTGGGFPGMVVALLRDDPVLLVEPRKRRADFLSRCTELLSLRHVEVRACRVEQIAPVPTSVISARAVAGIDMLLQTAGHIAHRDTRWILPRGRFGSAELDALRQSWHGVFHVEQSLADPSSSILIVEQVRRR